MRIKTIKFKKVVKAIFCCCRVDEPNFTTHNSIHPSKSFPQTGDPADKNSPPAPPTPPHQPSPSSKTSTPSTKSLPASPTPSTNKHTTTTSSSLHTKPSTPATAFPAPSCTPVPARSDHASLPPTPPRTPTPPPATPSPQAARAKGKGKMVATPPPATPSPPPIRSKGKGKAVAATPPREPTPPMFEMLRRASFSIDDDDGLAMAKKLSLLSICGVSDADLEEKKKEEEMVKSADQIERDMRLQKIRQSVIQTWGAKRVEGVDDLFGAGVGGGEKEAIEAVEAFVKGEKTVMEGADDRAAVRNVVGEEVDEELQEALRRSLTEF